MSKNHNTPNNVPAVILTLLVLVAFLLASVFYVYEGNRAFVQRFGKIISDDSGKPFVYDPGVHFKAPFIDTVIYLDVRTQTFSVPSDRIFTVEQKSVKIDYFVKWRIKDLVQYYLTTNADPTRTSMALKSKINDVLRAEVGKRELGDVITGERGSIIELLKQQADESASNLGVEVVDVRMVKLDYPPEVSQSVYERMQASRQRMATMYRAEGDAASEAIRAEGDAQVVKILAEARREAAVIKAEGDAEAAKIYDDAYSQNTDFYAFLRKLEVYSDTILTNETMVIDPKSFTFYEGLQSLGASNSTKTKPVTTVSRSAPVQQ
jgi:membrane protease subunit HflC